MQKMHPIWRNVHEHYLMIDPELKIGTLNTDTTTWDITDKNMKRFYQRVCTLQTILEQILYQLNVIRVLHLVNCIESIWNYIQKQFIFL